MYIRGVGRTRFGALNLSLPELMYDSVMEALSDSRLESRDIDAAIVSCFAPERFQSQLHINSMVSSLFQVNKLPVFRVEAACASGGVAVNQACHLARAFENVLVVGVEKMSSVASRDATSILGLALDKRYEQEEGMIFPAAYALIAQQHFLKFGSNPEDLALVSLKNHSNANKNELAHFYRKRVDLEDIRNSMPVSSPLRLFDCCPMSDGAASLVISARKTCDRDIRILGSSVRTDNLSLVDREDLTSFTAARLAARDAYSQAGIRPKDISFAEVHDCFTIAELIAMEDLDLCERGGSAGLVRKGETSLDGSIPVNTDGGLKADGHPIGATGIAQIVESVKQLRGEAGRRQIDDPVYGLTHNIGGIGGTAVVHILGAG
ncbi:thiolase domain-containing protein [Candidatus Bathyarchaeota archaeon]|nr:thiolase domain-containing protein [Candidatus Bathyarchaeota archaeon]